MSVEQIPAKTVFTCDRCKLSGQLHKPGPFNYAGLHVGGNAWGTGMTGDVGGTDVKYDFCRSCVESFNDWMSKGEKE